MSKKLLFFYITSSVLVVFTLLIIGLTFKIIFGGLNVNFVEQRLSSYLDTEYEVNFKSDELTLMYNEDIGLFIDVSKTDLILSNEVSFSSDAIKIDFNLIDLLYKKKAQLIKIMAEEILDSMDEIGSTGEEEKTVGIENLKVLENIDVELTVEVGRTEITIRELLRLNEGSVVELDRLAGDPLDILVNNTKIAKGEVVMIGERFGVRFGEIVDPEKRMESI